MNPRNLATLAARAASLVVVALALLPGCATTAGGAHDWLADLRDVAHVGARLDLADHPQHRAAYERTVQALETVATLHGLTPLHLHGALASLPIKELKGEKAVLYVTAAQILMRRVLDGREPVAVPGAVRDLAAALRDGLKEALK